MADPNHEYAPLLKRFKLGMPVNWTPEEDLFMFNWLKENGRKRFWCSKLAKEMKTKTGHQISWHMRNLIRPYKIKTPEAA